MRGGFLAGSVVGVVLAWGTAVLGARETPQIMVDQFGYRPEGEKMAVFADPVRGQNSGNRYVPGKRFEVRSVEGEVVFSGELRQWREGRVDEASGDRVWRADFSGMRRPGRYVI